MGALFSALMYMLNPRQEYKLIIVGLDNAGKTTTLYKLHLGEVVMTQPTIGSNVENVKFNNIHFEVWDLGGQATLRNSWQSYYRNTAAVIIVVDSTDRGRMHLVKEELFRLLGCEELSEVSVLVLGMDPSRKKLIAFCECYCQSCVPTSSSFLLVNTLLDLDLRAL